METESRFDLSRAIANWRAELAAEPGLSEDNLREIESHLREAIAAGTKSGSSERDAFHRAMGRLGDPTRLAAEFAAENPGFLWRQRLFWMALAALIVPQLFWLPYVALRQATALWQQWGSGASASAFEQAVLANWLFQPALIVGGLALLGRHQRLNLPGVIHWLTRSRVRLVLITALPVAIMLGAYVFTELAGQVWQWLKQAMLAAGMVIGLMALPMRCSAWLRRGVGWVIARRVRLGFVILLAVTPAALEIAWAMASEKTVETSRLLHLGAGANASRWTVTLILGWAILGLHRYVLAAALGTVSAPAANVPPAVGSPKLWRRRVTWMGLGCLLLSAWAVLEGGLHEVLTREVDAWWLRMLTGLMVPLACVAWLRQSIARPTGPLNEAMGTWLGKHSSIVTVVIVFAALSLCVNWLSLENAAETWNDDSFLQTANVVNAWLRNLLWPAAILGLVLWQPAQPRETPTRLANE